MIGGQLAFVKSLIIVKEEFWPKQQGTAFKQTSMIIIDSFQGIVISDNVSPMFNCHITYWLMISPANKLSQRRVQQVSFSTNLSPTVESCFFRHGTKK